MLYAEAQFVAFTTLELGTVLELAIIELVRTAEELSKPASVCGGTVFKYRCFHLKRPWSHKLTRKHWHLSWWWW